MSEDSEFTGLGEDIAFTVTWTDDMVVVLHSSAEGEVKKIVEPGSMLSTEDDSIDAIFARYYRTRTLLSNTDAACLENFANKCRENVDHLQGHVAKLQQDVFQLCQEIAKSLARIDQQERQIEYTRSLGAPIRSLPPETLDMIFELASSQSREPFGYVAVTDMTSPAMVVSQVCKLWRDVALRSSTLWHFPCMVIRKEWPEGLLAQQRLFELFVERGRSQTLALRIVNGPCSRIPKQSSGHRELLDQVSRAFPRCSYFEIHVQSSGLYNLLSEVEDTTITWPNLVRLSICSDILAQHLPPLKLFSHAPKLDCLELKVVRTRGLAGLLLPYHRLGVLQCEIRLPESERPDGAILDWQQLVWKCVQAHSLTLKLDNQNYVRAGLSSTSLEPTKIVALKKVTSLSIVNDLECNSDLLLSAFTFPSLDSLSFDFARASYFLPKSKTARQLGVESYFNLTNHFESITTLTVLRVSVKDGDLLELFKSAPRLTYLDLLNLTNRAVLSTGSATDYVIGPNDKHLVHLLSTMTATSHEDEGSFLPYLTILRLYYPYEVDDPTEQAEAYASMAKARARMNFQAVESGSRRVGLGDPKTYFEFSLAFRKGINTADHIRTVTKAMDSIKTLEPPRLHFEPDILPGFNRVLGAGYNDECLFRNR